LLPDAKRESLERLAAKVAEIEAEMKRIGFWTEDVPDLQAKARSGELHHFLNAPSFERWLQQIFIPNTRQAIEHNTLPAQSQVGLMAMRQYDYHSFIPEAQTLLELLHQFDQLVEAHAKLVHHDHC
jgi:uncharacterized protein YqcC (DUF446 family)